MIRLKNYPDSRKDGNAHESEIRYPRGLNRSPYYCAHHIAQVIYDALPRKILLGCLAQLNFTPQVFHCYTRLAGVMYFQPVNYIE